MAVPMDETQVQRCVSEESDCSQSSSTSSTSSHAPISTWMDRFSAEYMSALSRCLEMWPESDYSSAENRLFDNLTRVTEAMDSKSHEAGAQSMKSSDEVGTHAVRANLENRELRAEESDVKEQTEWRSAVNQSRIENCLRHSDAARALRFQRMIESFVQAHSAKGSTEVGSPQTCLSTENDTRKWMKLMVDKLSTMFIPIPSPSPVPVSSTSVSVANVSEQQPSLSSHLSHLASLPIAHSVESTVVPKSIIDDASLLEQITVQLRDVDQNPTLDRSQSQSSDLMFRSVSNLQTSQPQSQSLKSKSSNNVSLKKRHRNKAMMNRSPSVGSGDSAEESLQISKKKHGKSKRDRNVVSDSTVIPPFPEFFSNGAGIRASRLTKHPLSSPKDIVYLKKASFRKECRKRSNSKLLKKEKLTKGRSRSRSDGRSVGSHRSGNGLLSSRKRKASAMIEDGSSNTSLSILSEAMMERDRLSSASSISARSLDSRSNASKRRRPNDDGLSGSVDSTHSSQSRHHRF